MNIFGWLIVVIAWSGIGIFLWVCFLDLPTNIWQKIFVVLPCGPGAWAVFAYHLLGKLPGKVE